MGGYGLWGYIDRVCGADVIFIGSKSDILEVRLVPAVFALCEALGMPSLEGAEVLVEGDALVEVVE